MARKKKVIESDQAVSELSDADFDLVDAENIENLKIEQDFKSVDEAVATEEPVQIESIPVEEPAIEIVEEKVVVEEVKLKPAPKAKETVVVEVEAPKPTFSVGSYVIDASVYASNTAFFRSCNVSVYLVVEKKQDFIVINKEVQTIPNIRVLHLSLPDGVYAALNAFGCDPSRLCLLFDSNTPTHLTRLQALCKQAARFGHYLATQNEMVTLKLVKRYGMEASDKQSVAMTTASASNTYSFFLLK